MATIATLTLNPALDVQVCTDRVRPTHKLRCTQPSLEAGGGGINVARVVHALGGDVVAVFPCGGPAGATIGTLLHDAGVPFVGVPIAGLTRESFTVDESATGEQYRFVMPGPELSTDEQAALLGALDTPEAPSTIVVVSGSLPPGCDPAILRRLATECRRRGAKLVIDTSGPALAACEGANAYLVKPSLREVEELVGNTLSSEADEMAAAETLRVRGFAEVVVISLGERGALLVAESEQIRLPAVPVPPGGTVGAGDSMVAALAIAIARGDSLRDALRLGVAAGAAALMTPAAELVRREDVERLYALTT